LTSGRKSSAVIADESTRDVLSDPVVIEAYLGGAAA
jgi:ABC-type branched-subunit amino acid transport system ATPase component